MTMKKPSRLAREIAEMADAQRRLGAGALPSEKREPNNLTAETIAKSERGEDVHKAKDAEDLFKQLGI